MTTKILDLRSKDVIGTIDSIDKLSFSRDGNMVVDAGARIRRFFGIDFMYRHFA
jgi:hypothetical protein